MIDQYRRLNESFSNKLVFRFGDGAGFFSELNNMVLAMLYCLDAGIRFSLYSPPDGSLSIVKGWDDYFLPFCEETVEPFHKEHNERFLLKKPSLANRLKRSAFKRREGFSFYTYELWDRFRSAEFVGKYFSIPSLGLQGDLLSCTNSLIEMVWRFSPEFEALVEHSTRDLSLPAEYVGLHVRGGDKVIEAKIFGPDEYMHLVKAHTGIKDIFLLTDDYRNYRYLRDNYPEYRFQTTCREHETGYDFGEFLKLDKISQYEEYAKLLASVEVLSKAVLTIGSYKTNPGMFLGMRIGPKFIGIDSDKWLVMW